jgi:hypothetical protein
MAAAGATIDSCLKTRRVSRVIASDTETMWFVYAAEFFVVQVHAKRRISADFSYDGRTITECRITFPKAHTL